MQYIILISIGRTGSTALQFSLNSCPGVIVRGENNNAYYGLYLSYLSLTNMKSRFVDASESFHPWFGAPDWDHDIFIHFLRKISTESILQPSRDTTHLGFKEIRYTVNHIKEYGDLLNYLLFIELLFPGACFIFNIRNPNDTAKSGWWPKTDNAIEVIGSSNARLEKCAEDLNTTLRRQATVRIHYEEWSEDPKYLKPVWDLAKIPWDESSVAKALKTRLNH